MRNMVFLLLIGLTVSAAPVRAADMIDFSTTRESGFIHGLERVRSEAEASVLQFRYGFHQVFNDKTLAYSCVDATGAHGYNTVYPSDALRDGQAECGDLRHADFSRSKFPPGADFNGANLFDASMDHSDMNGIQMIAAVLVSARLDSSNLDTGSLFMASMQDCRLEKAHLYQVNLLYADLTGADLSGSFLEGAYLAYASLQNANFQGADLRGAALQFADVSSANFQNAIYDDQTTLPFPEPEAIRRGMIRR